MPEPLRCALRGKGLSKIMSLDKLPFNWFDVALVVVILMGIQRGRKRGMSEELLTLLNWLCVVVVCTVAYRPVGKAITGTGMVFDLLSSYLIAYVGIALLITGIFALIKRSAGGKLLGSDVFGRSEFYLGMLAGVVRFCCILIVGLALLNARYYSPAEIKAQTDFQNDVYGSTYFPTLCSLQQQVFDASMTGPWIKQFAGFLLIEPTTPQPTQLKAKEYAAP